MAPLNPVKLSYTAFLSASVATGALSTDMYLPSLPEIQATFNATEGEIQWTLSSFMVGIASFQLIIGPIADRFGRKKVLLGGLLIFILASFACVFTQSAGQMVFWRVVQSFGVCAAIVIPRAMVRDLYDREDSALHLSRIGTIMGLAPAIAPIIGGYIAVYYGWEGIFVALGTYGLSVALILIFRVEETLPPERAYPLNFKIIFQNYGELITSREYLGYVMTATLCFAGFFTYISSSAFVLITTYELPVHLFGYYFGFVVVGFMGGTLLGPRLTRLVNLRYSLQIGVFINLFGGALLLLLVANGMQNPFAIILPMVFYNLGVGIVMPQCQAGAMHPFPDKAGAASALSGFCILGLSGLLGGLGGWLFDGTAWPMVLIIFAMAVLTFICFHMTIFLDPRSRVRA